jgi:DNA-directed RNA polymerase subunit K/omega
MLYRQNITQKVIITILPHNTLVVKASNIIRGNNANKSTEFQKQIKLTEYALHSFTESLIPNQIIKRKREN